MAAQDSNTTRWERQHKAIMEGYDAQLQRVDDEKEDLLIQQKDLVERFARNELKSAELKNKRKSETMLFCEKFTADVEGQKLTKCGGQPDLKVQKMETDAVVGNGKRFDGRVEAYQSLEEPGLATPAPSGRDGDVLEESRFAAGHYLSIEGGSGTENISSKSEQSPSPVEEEESGELFDNTFAGMPDQASERSEPPTQEVPRDAKTTALRPGTVIAPSHPTIVRSQDGRWVELRCCVCGSNSNKISKNYYDGLKAFARHIKNSHPGRYPAGHRYGLANIKDCTYHVLSDTEAKGILQGDARAYRVLNVWGHST